MKVPGVPFVQGRNEYPDTDDRKFGMAIHNTSNDATDTQEASYATRRTDGVSSQFYVDKDSVTQSLDTRARAGHAGSRNGNENSISWEITGANGWSRQQWLNNVAWDKMGKAMAYLILNDPDFKGFEVRRASVREMQINPKVKAFYGHDDMRRAWGGTDHTDPGPNFPWDRLFQAVNKYLEGNDMDLNDLVSIPDWIANKWPDKGLQDKKIQVGTALGSGYGHARRAGDYSLVAMRTSANNEALLKDQGSQIAELRALIAGMTKLVQEALVAPAITLTDDQLLILAEAVQEAARDGAREHAERITRALNEAGEALARIDETDE